MGALDMQLNSWCLTTMAWTAIIFRSSHLNKFITLRFFINPRGLHKIIYITKFKSDLVIELLKGVQDLNTFVTENNIWENLLRNWKKEFLNNASLWRLKNFLLLLTPGFAVFNRISIYDKGTSVSKEELACKEIVDDLHTDNPTWGIKQMLAYVGGRKMRRYMKEMDIYPIYHKMNLSERM